MCKSANYGMENFDIFIPAWVFKTKTLLFIFWNRNKKSKTTGNALKPCVGYQKPIRAVSEKSFFWTISERVIFLISTKTFCFSAICKIVYYQSHCFIVLKIFLIHVTLFIKIFQIELKRHQTIYFWALLYKIKKWNKHSFLLYS